MLESPGRDIPTAEQKKQDVSAGSGSLVASRRRLLTGAAALPVVMTLPTNASAAAFGSTLRCLDNQAKQPKDYFTLSRNGWASETLRVFRVALSGGSDPWDVGDYGGGKYYDRTGRAWYPSGSKFKPVGYSGPGYAVIQTRTAYTYIYVGNDGKYWGVDPRYRSQGGLAVYGSCYTSIMGMGA